MASQKKVTIVVGVIIVRDRCVLLGQRRGSHGADTWALPGGHLEFGESIRNCAKREVFEETGLVVHSVRKVAFTNDYFEKEGKHYVTLFVLAEEWSGRPVVKEPDKCKGWSWFEWVNLPSPLFVPLQNLKNQGLIIPDDV